MPLMLWLFRGIKFCCRCALLRRGRWLHGAEPLVAERERRGLAADVETLLEGLPAVLFEAVTQREWEADVVWAAADSAEAAATAVRLEEGEEEGEEEAAVDKPEGPSRAGALHGLWLLPLITLTA